MGTTTAVGGGGRSPGGGSSSGGVGGVLSNSAIGAISGIGETVLSMSFFLNSGTFPAGV